MQGLGCPASLHLQMYMAQYIRSTVDHVIQYMIEESQLSCKQAGKQMGNQQIEIE